ncbi:MAG TPA: NUDIX hydrolase [Actinospica sp.]|nr:NUDIX hydrolase [Actinospica sp.]
MSTQQPPNDLSRIKASGAVLWRPGQGGAEPEIALIHRPRYDDWSFPKGKADPGEHAVLTAVREVEEETAHRVVLGRRLPDTEYEVLGRSKRVKYWAATAPKASDVEEFVPNDEVDELVWVGASQARKHLTSPLDATVLDAFLAGPPETFPIVLQRHGKAEGRGHQWPDDLLRPLAPAGQQQAIALAELLAVYGAPELISSPAVRCVDTVKPYADLYGIAMKLDSALTEISYVHAPRAVVSWLRDLADRRTGTVVCTHGPLLNELIAAALHAPGFAHPDREPTLNGQPWTPELADRWTTEPLPTGSAWILHFSASDSDSPRLVAVDRLKP